jgi:integrase
VGLLMAHLEGGTARRRKGMTGPQRALGYRVCMATGLRAGELRSLTRESFDLDAATVRCRAAYSKNRRESVQPIPAWLVAELRAWLDAGGGLWGSFPKVHPGRLLKADLAAAGVPYVVGGLFFDFHSLRHHYVTWVANHPGISPKTLMELARLSSADLAMKTYAHARRADLHRTVEDLPRPGG